MNPSHIIQILYVLNSPPEWKAFKENRPGNMVDRHGNEVEEPFPEPGTRPRVLRDLRILPRVSRLSITLNLPLLIAIDYRLSGRGMVLRGRSSP